MAMLAFMVADVLAQPGNHPLVLVAGAILTAYAMFTRD